MPTSLPAAEAPLDAQSVLSQIPDTVARTIDVLSAKLASPAEQLFTALSGYVYAQGATSTVLAALWFVALLASASLAVVWSRAVAKSERFDDPQAALCLGVVICVVVSGISLGSALDHVQEGLPKLLAPEGAALVTLLRGALP